MIFAKIIRDNIMRFRYFLLFLNLSFSLSVISLTTIFLSHFFSSPSSFLSHLAVSIADNRLSIWSIFCRGPIYHSVVHVYCGPYITLWSMCRSVVHIISITPGSIYYCVVHISLCGPSVGLGSIALLHRPHKQDHNLHGPAGALGECAPLESRGQTSVQPWGDDPPAQSECRRTGPEPSGVSCKFLDSETPRDISLVKQLRIIVCSSF